MSTQHRRAARKRADKVPASSKKGRTYFPGKILRPTTISLTPVAKSIGKEAERRTKASRSDVVEGLLRKHGATLTEADLIRLSREAAAKSTGDI
jgi:hypothetical protein